MVLLSLLRELAPSRAAALSALHVNHGLSPHADAWEAFCTRLCVDWNIPLRVQRVAVERGDSLESQARRARYGVFDTLGEVSLALAHHSGDQAETVLLNLLRGAGVRGAGGMPPLRTLAGGARLMRPLLEVSRAQILDWAQQQGLAWVEDESNADTHFSRNFLRHRVMPVLSVVNPDCEQALVRASRRFRESESLLEVLADIDIALAMAPSGGVRVQALVAMGAPRARNLLRTLLRRAGAPAVTGQWLEQALGQMVGAREDGSPIATVAAWTLRRYRGVVHVVAPLAGAAQSEQPWRGEESVAWGGTRVRFDSGKGMGFVADAAGDGHWCLRLRCGGESMRMTRGGSRRSLKNLLQEAGVPPWQRQHMPLLYHDGILVWAPGIGIAIEYRCPESEAGFAPQWVRCKNHE